MTNGCSRLGSRLDSSKGTKIHAHHISHQTLISQPLHRHPLQCILCTQSIRSVMLWLLVKCATKVLIMTSFIEGSLLNHFDDRSLGVILLVVNDIAHLGLIFLILLLYIFMIIIAETVRRRWCRGRVVVGAM